MTILPCFKSHYSIGKSILTLDEPFDKSGKPNTNSIFHILKENNLKDLTLVEDNVSGILQASQNAEKSKINLFFGLRITILDDIQDKSEESLKKEGKYIIFVKNTEGYKDLIKIWSSASIDGFYYQPRICWKTLKKLWSNNLKLCVPFYDSFLHLNTLEGYNHVPDYSFVESCTYLLEDNNLPFDSYLREKVIGFTKDIKAANPIESQSIYYKSPNDFTAYLAFRCLNNRSTLEKPELSHMGSDEFNFEKWKKSNE